MDQAWRVTARAATWPLVPGLLAGMALIALREPGRAGGTGPVLSEAPYFAALAACYVVGVLLTARVFEQPAGWAFLGLASSLAWSGFTEVYAVAALAGALPGGPLLATFSDTSFVWWFLFAALALQLTPAVRPPGRGWPLLPVVTIASAFGYQVGALLRSRHLDDPFTDVVSPWAVASLAGPAAGLAFVGIVTLGLCLLASVHVLLSAFRRARGESRQQLLWLVAGALPVAPGVVASFAASYAGFDWLAGPALSASIVTMALGAGLSVARYRLYDVERVVTDSTAYALATGAVITAFAVVVVVITQSVPVAPTSQLPTVLATLAGVGVARPAYVWARNLVDRRFNRRRFDALRVVEAGLSADEPDLEALLRKALDDPSARLLFRAADGWVTADGRVAEPGPHAVEVTRRGTVSALLIYHPARCERTLVEALVARTAAEIDNLGLRAELARQVAQVTESRARLATAHLHERRRMERDLHDGAQQRLLAIALQLQSARVNGTEAVLRTQVERAVASLGATVQELRALAGGLQPPALAGGGLRAATEDLASRIPLRMKLDVVEQRFPATVESAAWFVVAEGVANAVKHAEVDEVEIAAYERRGQLHVVVADEGVGGVDERGSGLQGLADRVAALGGRLSAGPGVGGGTRLEAVFPCG